MNINLHSLKFYSEFIIRILPRTLTQDQTSPISEKSLRLSYYKELHPDQKLTLEGNIEIEDFN